jgi:hypothetical protein
MTGEVSHGSIGILVTGHLVLLTDVLLNYRAVWYICTVHYIVLHNERNRADYY